MKERAMTVAYITLFTGIGLVAFTFINAYIFLISNPDITASSDIADVFGKALAPLISGSIRIMYLGVMGWTASILTARGVQLITQLKRLRIKDIQPKTSQAIKPARQSEK